jgi:hypothetical protein
MQRWIWAILAAGAFVSIGSLALADGKPTPNYDGRLLRRHREQLRKERADELCFERARMRARERYNGKWPEKLSDDQPGVRKNTTRQ